MRQLHVSAIANAVKDLCITANQNIPQDLECCIRSACQAETDAIAKDVLQDLCSNIDEAHECALPICQDTGMAVVFVRLGQDVHIEGGSLQEAVNRGISMGYTEGRLRASVVLDPLRRTNSGDNTPAILHVELVEGDACEITVAPKGFGSENMSRVYMLTPSADRQTIIDTVCETVRAAGSNPCPPLVLGIGIGGDFEQVAYLSKKALCRPVSQANPDPYYAELEADILTAVNALGIGPQGFGGRSTALAVLIETAPTHIAGLPLAVNIGCHVTRHASVRV